MQRPYLFIPLAIIILLLYSFSLILVKFDIWSRSSNRKLWNTILLFTFLVTAIIGLLLVIKVNYKLEWNAFEKLLAWHVDFGIAMSFVATFHLIWHFSYFINLLKKKQPEKKSKPVQNISSEEATKLSLLFFLSGFASIVIQVLLIRELTTIFQGNEFMMGWTIGIWMLLTGTGAYLGRRFDDSKINLLLIRNILITSCAFPPALIVLLNYLKNIIFPPGILISPFEFLLLSILMLAPICLLAGILFSLFVRVNPSDHKGFIRVYAFEAAGSLFGGIAVTLLFINWLSILQSLVILLLIITLVMYFVQKNRAILIFLSFLSVILLLLFVFPMENKIRSRLFLNQTIIENKETFYGNITVTDNAGEYNFFYNGSLIYSSGNFILREEYTHYALLQCKKPEKVLIVSGVISGMLDEVLKYPSIKSVDCIEMNPKLIRLGKKYNLLPYDSRVNLIRKDGVRYIAETDVSYDAVIMAIPDPSSLQINRYYTSEFLTDLKKHLNDHAVILYGVSSTGNYLSDVQANKLSILVNTLKSCFNFVEILPGEKDYLLASDSPISLSISSLYSSGTVENIYVNSDYIDDASIQLRSKSIRANLPQNEIVNTNNRPLPVFFDTLRFISLFYTENKILAYFPLLLLLLPLFFMKPESTGMYIAGFSGASVELLLIFAFQIIYGYVYSALGIIVAIFMAGLATGSLFGYRLKKISNYLFPFIHLMLMFFFFLLPFVLNLFGKLNNPVLFWLVFICITLIPSTIIGYLYVIASISHSNDTFLSAPAVYSADLLGSALGVIASTVILVPLIGIEGTCFIIAAMHLIGAVYYSFRRNVFF